jgi:hypothetical protein
VKKQKGSTYPGMRSELAVGSHRLWGRNPVYKIHSASGNILKLPDDHYLCIVPKPTADSARVLFPFEGDRLFSIILSKAFPLADDFLINNPTITRQIGQKK